MSARAARLVFCLVPAVLVAIPLGCIHPFVGFISFVAVLGLGLSVTERKPERGE